MGIVSQVRKFNSCVKKNAVHLLKRYSHQSNFATWAFFKLSSTVNDLCFQAEVCSIESISVSPYLLLIDDDRMRKTYKCLIPVRSKSGLANTKATE